MICSRAYSGAPSNMKLPVFSDCRVLVAGDLMLDRYWHGGTSRISPEAPVPVVKVEQIEERAGGAGNVALNIAALGAKVRLVAHSGNDEAGESLITLLTNAGVDCRIRKSDNRPTITKLRVLSRHQQLIRLDFEEGFGGEGSENLKALYLESLEQAQVVVLSDYGKGTLEDMTDLISAARACGKPVLVDPKGTDFERYRHATLMTPNRSEFERVAGRCENLGALVEKGVQLRDQLELEGLLITRGDEGMTLLQKDQPPLHLPALAKEVYDVTGAGDTVIASLASCLAGGLNLADSTRIANTAAGIVVGKLGTATPTSSELMAALHGQRSPDRGALSLKALKPLIESAQKKGERIVLTNGCFDILHPGHVDYLQRARALGDRLVVLVNSDASVQRIKGPERPINALDHRMTLLSALECVDWVTPFDEDTPRDAIGLLGPDILVKGGDYTAIESIAGHDHVLARGGKVQILPFIEGHSTTGLIERINARRERRT